MIQLHNADLEHWKENHDARKQKQDQLTDDLNKKMNSDYHPNELCLLKLDKMPEVPKKDLGELNALQAELKLLENMNI